MFTTPVVPIVLVLEANKLCNNLDNHSMLKQCWCTDHNQKVGWRPLVIKWLAGDHRSSGICVQGYSHPLQADVSNLHCIAHPLRHITLR